jgi:hypothetical protein
MSSQLFRFFRRLGAPANWYPEARRLEFWLLLTFQLVHVGCVIWITINNEECDPSGNSPLTCLGSEFYLALYGLWFGVIDAALWLFFSMLAWGMGRLVIYEVPLVETRLAVRLVLDPLALFVLSLALYRAVFGVGLSQLLIDICLIIPWCVPGYLAIGLARNQAGPEPNQKPSA